MGTNEIFVVISGLVALVTSSCTIIAFYLARKKDTYSTGRDDASLRLELKYITKAVDDIRLDIKGYERQQNLNNEKMIRYDELLKNHERRLTSIEQQAINSKKGD